MRSALATTLVAAVAVVGGCRFDAPTYEGTTFACEPPLESCPPGFICLDGYCTTGEGGGGDVDAGGDVDGAPPANTQTMRIEIAYDTTIRSDAPTTNDGPLAFLEIDSNPRRVSLMYFDLSSIPAGAPVVAAALRVVVFDPIETGTFQLYPLTESWSENAATWEERETGVPWSPTGMSVPTLDATAILGEVAPRVPGSIGVTLDVVQVQGWITTPSSNHGIALVSTSPDGRGGQLRSTEYSVVAERPFLIVTFASP